jgi:iron complex transport system substrate-binding protein
MTLFILPTSEDVFMRKLAIAIALALLGAACGGADAATEPSTTALPATTTTTASPPSSTTPPSSTAPPTTVVAVESPFPARVAHGTGEVTITQRPEAIVSLSATATEILFALGAGDQVAAVDSQSNYPPGAPLTDLTAFTPSVEAIAALEPDLVVMSFDPGDIESGLTALDIPVMVQFPALSLEDMYTQMSQLGMATDHVAAADTLVADIQETIAELREELGGRTEPLTYYYELDDTYYTVTSSTFVGELFSVVGLVSIADPAAEEGFGFPQLSPEFILEANPDLIFLADTLCCAQSALTVAQRPGWDELTAVQNGSIVELNDDVASRWGPRIVDLLEEIVAAIEKYEANRTD